MGRCLGASPSTAGRDHVLHIDTDECDRPHTANGAFPGLPPRGHTWCPYYRKVKWCPWHNEAGQACAPPRRRWLDAVYGAGRLPKVLEKQK